MALDLISAFSGNWQPKKYKDTYTAALRKVVRAKVQGKEVHYKRGARGRGAAGPDGGTARVGRAGATQLTSDREGHAAQVDGETQVEDNVAALT